MTNLTQTALSDAIKTEYERRLLTRALPRLVHGRWAIMARLNKYGSYELRKYGSLSAVTTALTEGTTPAEQAAMSLTLTTVTPAFYGAWIGHSDELEMTVFDPLLSEVSSILGEQAGLSADTLIRNTLTDGATKDYSGGVSARASLDSPLHDLEYSDIVKQIAALEADNALPADGEDFIVIMHPHDFATLMQDPTFVNLFTNEIGDSPIRSGYMGRLLRCKIFISSNSREYADGGVANDDVYSMLFIGKESYGIVGMGNITPNVVDMAPEREYTMTGKAVKPVEIIAKQLGSAGAADPINQRATVAWKMALATTVLNSAWVRDLEHVNAFSAE